MRRFFHLLMAPTLVAFSPSCWPGAHPSLAQGQECVSGVLRQPFGLVHGGEVQLIQVRGEQEGFLKKNYQICEGQNSC